MGLERLPLHHPVQHGCGLVGLTVIIYAHARERNVGHLTLGLVLQQRRMPALSP